jgi:hypothetical protein
MDELYACEVGTALWEAHREDHPEAPVIPPVAEEDWPAAVEYWDHHNECEDCNEI